MNHAEPLRCLDAADGAGCLDAFIPARIGELLAALDEHVSPFEDATGCSDPGDGVDAINTKSIVLQ